MLSRRGLPSRTTGSGLTIVGDAASEWQVVVIAALGTFAIYGSEVAGDGVDAPRTLLVSIGLTRRWSCPGIHRACACAR